MIVFDQVGVGAASLGGGFGFAGRGLQWTSRSQRLPCFQFVLYERQCLLFMFGNGLESSLASQRRTDAFRFGSGRRDLLPDSRVFCGVFRSGISNPPRKNIPEAAYSAVFSFVQ